MSTMKHNANLNNRMDLVLRSYIKNDKASFVKELRSKGFKMTGREGVDKIMKMLLKPKP